eukprot:CAMPEP_0176252750 /NCGR_PEP_ID=MMETSP0121_2-20121125/35665_1 /TAXON_ID=160619 /ORGANISM="Kryptoperidinium foliaceum, Strain CCMP 1326" /LENGTH=198 /DNA_ID=CAMNT_0017592513 /DNA_START=127 /DNA_END=724 /DNA_ORIENTATION=+
MSVRLPWQQVLVDSKRTETLAELADRHFGRALRLFDELHEDREVAVCHFHMADLALQELKFPDSPPLSKPRITAALRHARRSAEYWERGGLPQFANDFIASHIRIARLLECQQRAGAIAEAASTEARLLSHVEVDKVENPDLYIIEGQTLKGVAAFRREMSRACQSGLRQGEDVERLKAMYRKVLRNEPIESGAGGKG